MKLTLVLLLLLFSCDEDSKKAKSDNNLVNEINKDSIYTNLKSFSDFGTKSVGTSGNTSTRNWIINKLSDYGYSYSLQNFSVSNNTGYNIIIDKNGSISSNKYIIICGHYDSVTRGSGANDNGSGVSVMIEILRLIKDKQFEKNLRFIFFDAEENGLIGSYAYADKIVADNETVEFVLNLDMIGGHKNMNHSKIVCEEDQNGINASDSLSHAYNLRLVDAFNEYSSLTPVIDEAYGTDYVPFEKKGFTIIGLYEYRGQSDNPNYHRSTDLFENIHSNYTFEAAKGAMAFLSQELNKAM